MRLVYKLINFLSRLVLHPNPNGSRRIIDCFLAAPCQHLRRKLSQFGRIFIEQPDGVKGSADVKTCLTTWYSHEWTPLRVTLSNSLEWTIWMKYSKPRIRSCPNHLWMVVGLGNSPGYIIYLLAKSSDLDWFMILIEKVDQKVHQNHATSWEWNHDRIVIPVPEFVPFACSVSSGLRFATFVVQSGLSCFAK